MPAGVQPGAGRERAVAHEAEARTGMKGYWLILGGEVFDQAAQQEYGRLWGPIAERYGAMVIRGAAAPELREGRDTARVLVVEFPSYAAARACYEDPDYEAARVLALKASRRDLLLFEGEIAAPPA